MEQKNDFLGRDPIGRLLWRMSLPAIVAQLINLLYNLVDRVYIGHMPQLMSSSVSYKNHKRTKKDKSEWIITYNTHEPIITQELWIRYRQDEIL